MSSTITEADIRKNGKKNAATRGSALKKLSAAGIVTPTGKLRKRYQ
ncbi:MAG: hypothetical protein FWD55_02700 [Propionibacteriaceae bacterium]|nr:hypothetical protein [Propionibacteriaceae bacterium]